jgi:hypothetical protein
MIAYGTIFLNETEQYMGALGIPNDKTVMYEGTWQKTRRDHLWTFVNNHIKELMGKGRVNRGLNIWEKMVAVYPFIGGTADTHKFNLKNPADSDAAFRIEWVGNTYHSRLGSFSYSGVGKSKIIPSVNLSQDSVHLSAFTSDTFGAAFYTIGFFPSLYIRQRELYLYDLTVDNAVNTGTYVNLHTGGRRKILTRTDSTTVRSYVDGRERSYNIASQVPDSAELFVVGMNALGFPDGQYSCGITQTYQSIGFGLSSAEAKMLDRVVNNLQTELKRHNTLNGAELS